MPMFIAAWTVAVEARDALEAAQKAKSIMFDVERNPQFWEVVDKRDCAVSYIDTLTGRTIAAAPAKEKTP